MEIICDKCGFNNARRDGILNEEYLNIYGTVCVKCGNIIKPLVSNKILEKKDIKMAELRNEMIEKLRKNFGIK